MHLHCKTKDKVLSCYQDFLSVLQSSSAPFSSNEPVALVGGDDDSVHLLWVVHEKPTLAVRCETWWTLQGFQYPPPEKKHLVGSHIRRKQWPDSDGWMEFAPMYECRHFTRERWMNKGRCNRKEGLFLLSGTTCPRAKSWL